jgi:UMF1 family MFS transporter
MTMGVLTVMSMAATFATKELRLSDSILIATILLIQLIGMFGAWLFARLSGRYGNIRSLIISIVIWIFVIMAVYFVNSPEGFVIVACFVGVVMGGTQALARSTYSKMLPETRDHTSFFSFYDVMEKFAMVGGTFSFGIIEALTGSMRYSVLAITVFFLIGLVFMLILLRKQQQDG